MKEALVTGASGFLGRHFIQALYLAGYYVVGPDIKKGNFAQDALWHFNQTDTRYDLVVHCAAVIGGRTAIDGRPLDLSVNLDLDAAYARWLVTTRPHAAVYISSSAVYPTALQGADARALTETDVMINARIGVPDQIYGWSKLVGEALMAEVQRAGVPVTIVRPFSGYGRDQDLTYPFRAFLLRAFRREDPFTVWGPGTDVRDWVHVDDIVTATLTAVSAQVPYPMNICTGRATTFDQLAAMMYTEAGYKPELHHKLDAPRGVSYRVGDPEQMHQIYVPHYSLEERIHQAFQSA